MMMVYGELSSCITAIILFHYGHELQYLAVLYYVRKILFHIAEFSDTIFNFWSFRPTNHCSKIT